MPTADIINDTHPEVQAIRDALETTFAMFCGAAPAFKGAPSAPGEGQHIISIISLLGDRSRSLMLSLPEKTAAAIAVKFCGFEIPFESGDMADVVGELANILAGSAVAKLEGIGVKTEMSLPSVIRGTDLDVPVPDGQQIVRMAYDSLEGPFLFHVLSGESGHSSKKGK